MTQTSLPDVQTCVRAVNQHARGKWQDEELASQWDENEDQFLDVLLSEIVDEREDLKSAGLSDREAEAAIFSNLGVTYPAMAYLLTIDESTVGEYMRRVRQKKENAERLLRALDAHGIEL